MNIVLRSAITTFFSTLLTLLPVSLFAISGVPWIKIVVVAIVISSLQTFIVYLDPKNPNYGRGSSHTVELPTHHR